MTPVVFIPNGGTSVSSRQAKQRVRLDQNHHFRALLPGNDQSDGSQYILQLPRETRNPRPHMPRPPFFVVEQYAWRRSSSLSRAALFPLLVASRRGPRPRRPPLSSALSSYPPFIYSCCTPWLGGYLWASSRMAMAASVFHYFVVYLILAAAEPCRSQQLPGTWEVLVENAGIASMHSAVTRYGTVVLLDRTDIGPSRRLLPRSRCRVDPSDRLLPKLDCYAHSVLFDPATRRVRPLKIETDTWCSSGQFLPDGTLLQTGGDLDGFKKLRAFHPCPPDDPLHLCDWEELEDPELAAGRWYATDQILPDGSVIIVGGRAANSVEFYPPRPGTPRPFPFLADAEDTQMDNLYPYVHLLPDGNLFVFANTRAILYEHATGKVLQEYPQLEGGPRNYPSAGSSAMLALTGDFSTAEVVVCGGAEYGVFIEKSTDTPAHGTCGRIVATDPDPVWSMETMPFGRIMGDMVMLPTGDVLVVNGAQAGSQGFELASNPCLSPVLYRPSEPAGLRFMTLTPTGVPRLYHSTANLLPDGRVLVAGSNPHYFYKFRGPFPTELRLEAFSPEYLSPDRANLRPSIVSAPERVKYGEAFQVEVEVELPVVGVVEVNLASAPFATHSFSMGQRLVKLNVSPPEPLPGGSPPVAAQWYRVGSTAPPSGKVAPPGYYMAFAVNQGVPSVARWIQIIP